MTKITTQSLRFSSVIIGIVASAMILFSALVLKDSETSFTGLNVAFGHEFANLGWLGNGEIKFSFMTLIAYSLPLVASLLILSSKRNWMISTTLFIASAILMFLIPEFTVVQVTVLGIENQIDVAWTYGIGLISSAALSAVGAFIGLYAITSKK